MYKDCQLWYVRKCIVLHNHTNCEICLAIEDYKFTLISDMQKWSVYVRLRAGVISYVLNKYSVCITVCSKVHALFMFKNPSLYVPQYLTAL